MDALGRQVSGRNYPPTNKNTLIRALTEEWDKLPQQLLDNGVQSMTGLETGVMADSSVPYLALDWTWYCSHCGWWAGKMDNEPMACEHADFGFGDCLCRSFYWLRELWF
ncbi:hypothetical protein TNCV_3310981 [Trichonephila clavipes]|nr:hypothetical protein TNCV_3310981 [Trichonephila clavipes]